MEKKKKELPHILKQKKMYIFLAIFTLVGIIFGCVFITMLNDIDHQLVSRQLQDFFFKLKKIILIIKKDLSTVLVPIYYRRYSFGY